MMKVFEEEYLHSWTADDEDRLSLLTTPLRI